MQILSIHLKNIKSHREKDLTFSPGINVLSGPNGVGKSTIFQAIGYTLFGVDAQSFVGNVDRFITIGAKRGEIAVVFQITDEERYKVSRTVGTPSKWLLAKKVAGEFEVEEHKDSKETESRLKELLGLKGGRSLAEQFELVIGPFQNEFLGPFVIKQPTKRRDKFDEILGIDTWRKTFNETKTLARTIKVKVEVLESAIGPLKDQVAEFPEKKGEYKTTKQTLEATEKELKSKQRKLQELETLLVEFDKREQTLKGLEAGIGTLRERIDNGKEKISNQKLLIGEAEKANKIIKETATGKKAFEQAEASLIELREQVKEQRRLEKEEADLNVQVGKLGERFRVESKAIEKGNEEITVEERSLTETRKSLAIGEEQQKLAGCLPDIRSTIDQVRKQIGQLEGRCAGLEEGSEKLAEGICPFFQEPCLNIAEKPPGDVFSDKFAGLDKERQRLNAEIEKLEQEEVTSGKASDQLKEIEVKIQGLDEQVEKLAVRRKVNEMKAEGLIALQKEQDTLQQQLAEKRKSLATYNRLQSDIDGAEKEKSKHQEVRDLYVANQQQAAELEQRRDELEKFEQLFKELQNELVTKDESYRKANKKYNAVEHEEFLKQKGELSLEVGALGQKVKGLHADVARLAAEIGKLKQIEKDIAAKQDQIKSYKEKDALVMFLRNRVFKQVSGYLSERFREEISQRANRIYRIIAEVDEELAWGDDYRIVLRDMVDGELRERVDDQLSGGQTMSAVVALRLALLQTIGARIAFFDEPTSNLDAVRRENLAHAFRAIDVGKEEVTEHWYDQLFLISHDVAFTEVTDQIVTLE
jgi:exonuclease SbcC